MSKALLMVAFHFPPAAMSSGHLRTLGFARYLPEVGWEPIVLSARSLAYPRTAPVNAGSIPDGCSVHRAFALDIGRHLALAGAYPGFLASPDRWASWWFPAVFMGLRLIRRHRVKAIWSTYPIMTAHCIARTLSRITKVPWVADFRDPVSGSVSRDNRFAMASQFRWEERVLRDATHVTLTTPSALRDYAARYPDIFREGRLSVIQNGYDEAAFAGVRPELNRRPARPLVLLHSGVLYPDGRDPFPFFAALKQLKTNGNIRIDQLKVVLRGSSCEARYQHEIKRLGITDLVSLAPPVGNHEALLEQAAADGLLLFQGRRFDRQIPAKLYEYIRIGRPIFALVGEAGDTAALLHEVGGAVLVSPNDVQSIANGLARFVQLLARPSCERVDVIRSDVAKWSRRERTADLATLLAQVTG